MSLKSVYVPEPRNQPDANLYVRRTGAKAETFPRYLAAGSSLAPTSGTMYLVAISVGVPSTISGITFLSGSTALSGQTNWWAALYTPALALIAQTPDLTNTGTWAANTEKTFSLSTPVVLAPGMYYVAIMVAATQPPTIQGVATTSTIGPMAPVLMGTSDTGLTTTAPATAAALTSGVRYPLVYLT